MTLSSWRMLALSIGASAALTCAAPAESRDGDHEREAAEIAEHYFDLWSAPNDVMLKATPALYGSTVAFYGRDITQSALIAEKRRFAERWPVRAYRHRPDSVRVDCDAEDELCTVRSRYDYTVANPRGGRQARGSSALEIGVSFASGRPVIVSETTWKAPGGDRAESHAQAPSGPDAAPVEDPRRAVALCRDYLARATAPYGQIKVEVGRDGPSVESADGALAVPLSVKVVYARAGGPETRTSPVVCKFDAAGRVVGVK